MNGKGKTREERISAHKKQERLQIKDKKPTLLELKEGVPVLSMTSEGLTEYTKYKEIMYKKVWDLGTGSLVEDPAGAVTNADLAAWTGSSYISQVGTITGGIWNGDIISIANGGTGESSLEALIALMAAEISNIGSSAGIVTLSTGSTDVDEGDLIGKINFQAPSEGSGTDAILVGASIHAEAEEDFSSSNNSTGLVFSTGTTSVPIERMRIDQDGDITITSDAAHKPILTLRNNHDGSSPTALAFLKDNSGSANDSDEIGYVKFQGYNDANQLTTYADFFVYSNDVSDGTEDGSIYFRTATLDGTLENTLILRSNKVGIGETDPCSTLHVNATSSTTFDATDTSAQDANGATLLVSNQNTTTNSFAQLALYASESSNRSLGRIACITTAADTSALAFVTETSGACAEKMRILGNGKVGIGTAAPTKELHVKAVSAGATTLRVQANGANDAILELASEHAYWNIYNDDNPDALRFAYNDPAGDMMTILSSGNVGIGNIAPGSLLEISATASDPLLEISCWSTGDTNAGYLKFQKSAHADINTLATTADGEDLGGILFYGVNAASTPASTVAGQILFEGDAAPTDDANDAVPGKMSFWTSDDVSSKRRMSIDDAGNVGIGTATPTRKLQVSGDPGNDGELVCFDNGHSTVDDNDVILLLRFNGDADATNGHYIEFADNDTAELTGTIIASSGTATNNTVSDYRIKENISLITGGLAKVNALKPSYFNYKSYPNKVHQGFVAHEVVEAGIDYAVFGEKDAMKTDKRKDSPTYGQEVINQQQFAITNIIPQLVSAIQELSAEVEKLKSA